MNAAVAEFELIPTPREFVGPVYRLLANLMADGEGSGDVTAAAEEGDSEEPTLTPDLVRRMFEESHEHHREMLKSLAAHPDEWFYSDALAQRLGLEGGSRSLAGMLGAFGRRANHRYSGLKPFVSEWDAGAYQARHKMPAEVAQIIRDL